MTSTTGVSILAISAVLPAHTLSNAELEARFGQKEMASIIKTAGIQQRRVAAPGQCASDLALTAAERLFQHKSWDRSLVDMLMFVSQTPDYRIPTTASVLHGKLGLKTDCATFDINQACSAFPYALSVAHSSVVSGQAHYALVINADTLTSLIHPNDRSLVALHGDAACATLVGPCGPEFGFEGFSLGTDGTGASHLIVPAGGMRMPSSADTRQETTDEAGCTRTHEHIKMNGPAVFHFSVYRVPEAIRDALSKIGRKLEEVDLVILHQANKMMLDLIFKSLRVPADKQFFCIENMGNSSGPSTAVALSEAWRLGRIKPGSRTLLCSFGAGLTWGISIIHWPENADPALSLDPIVREEEMLSAAL